MPWWEIWRKLPAQGRDESNDMLAVAAHPRCGLAGIMTEQRGWEAAKASP